MSNIADETVPLLTEAMLRRLDRPGPRYTSSPMADRFGDTFGPDVYARALARRASGATVGGRPPLSVYVHIPFCESVCYCCACNKGITRHHGRAAEYLDVLAHEVALNVAVLGSGHAVSQLHLGGGTPTVLSDAELSGLMAMLQRSFKLVPGAEISIKVDPRTASPDRLRHLAALGFNRLSLGVQDFDADMQQAVHRVQPYESVRDLIAAAREIGFESINADLIYGLPSQTPASFAHTVNQVAGLRPDRIALYAYAHLPTRCKPQRRIIIEQLPPPEHRVQMLGDAISGFVAQGYTYIGMDHFALPGDSLAAAKRQGRLHRNFQGYSTQPDCDLIALGVSAIGNMGAGYSQNAKTLDGYCDAIRQGQFAVVRGLTLARNDLVRRAVVMALMCQGRLDFESIKVAHLIRMADYFNPELDELAELQVLGLCTLTPDAVQVTSTGWYFVRAVAMVFDRFLRTDPMRERFSRTI